MTQLKGNPYCPNCGVIVDGVTSVEGNEEATPKEGDWTICIYCCAALMFTKDIQLRLPYRNETIPDDIDELRNKVEIIKQVQNITDDDLRKITDLN